MAIVQQPETAFGIDIGGTGIKGGVVDLRGGVLIGDRFRLDTPQPSTPQAVAETAGKVAANFDYQGPFGVAFPGVVLHGVVKTAANVDKGWIDTSLQHAMEPELPGPVTVLNDADAAGLAEARYGAGRGRRGLVIVVTFGTGIGIALVNDGKLVPNAELGHIELDGHDAEIQGRGIGQGAGRAELGAVGQAGVEVPAHHREPAVAGAVHPGWRHLQEARQVGAAAEEPDPAGGRPADQQRRHRRRRAGGQRGRRGRISRRDHSDARPGLTPAESPISRRA